MLQRTYENLTELFYSLNEEIIFNTREFQEGSTGTNIYIKPMTLRAKSIECDLNLGTFHYQATKMNYLVNNYLDINNFKDLIENLKNSKGTSLTFYFKTVKPKRGTTSDNGPCLLNIVLTRETRKSKWNRCFINYRTTEINRRFGADLIFFNKIIQELPSCCEIKDIYLIIPKAYLNIRFATTQVDMNLITHDSELHKKLRKEYLLMSDKERRYSSYKSKHKIERILRGEETEEKIDISKFKIIKEE